MGDSDLYFHGRLNPAESRHGIDPDTFCRADSHGFSGRRHRVRPGGQGQSQGSNRKDNAKVKLFKQRFLEKNPGVKPGFFFFYRTLSPARGGGGGGGG